MQPIVLASGSPRRRQLLEWAEIPFHVIVSDADESFTPGTAPHTAAMLVAGAKARAVAARGDYKLLDPRRPILAADTMVVLEGDIIGKPRDRQDAIHILSRLSGHRHEVVTGVVLLQEERCIEFSDITAVWFNELPLEGIEHYVDRYAPYDKAGSYAIQEWVGVVGIRRIEGDFYNVMGLPISRVVSALNSFF